MGMWEGFGMIWRGERFGQEWKKVQERKGMHYSVSQRVWAEAEGHGWHGLRIVWMMGRLGTVKYAWVCPYPPVNGKGKKGK